MKVTRDLSQVTIGILGGGQLARMTVEAASRLNFKVAILEAEAESPAGQIAAFEIVGHWSELEALEKLVQACEVITLENEFVDAEVLQRLEASGRPVYPSALTLALVQDKARQKQTLAGAGLPVPAFAAVSSPEEVLSFGANYGWPLVLKARRNGYDGRGNYTLRLPTEIAEGFERLGWPERTLLVEQYVPFVRELAVMVVRGKEGATGVYPVVETIQKHHICHSVTAPAELAPEIAAEATRIARQAIEAIAGVGVFGVELFLTEANEVLINELAPRPHNSGHYTIEACRTSQYENHLRAVLGLPLGATDLIAPAAMVNLLGVKAGRAVPHGLEEALAVPGANVHLYAKALSRPGRKMGHITALAPGGSPADALALAQKAASLIEF
ncbi:MAG: 5-(carboxyamino)imidazole ribonucleotide synthase [Chloroflexi bacterium]|nr:5-(carboxyamino)imidazole ribonucleotide synthase [Chloroflexota bacterium]